jgi:hypothetical protein
MKTYLLPVLLFLASFSPVDPPEQVHQFETDVREHSPMWWVPPGFGYIFPQVAWHFIPIPAPTTTIKSIEIEFTDNLDTYLGANSWLNQYQDIRTTNTQAFTSVKIRGANAGRLAEENISLGDYELFNVPFGEFIYTDTETNTIVIKVVIDDPKVIEFVNNAEEGITLSVRSFSTYDISFLHNVFIHRLLTTSQITGEITYHIQP